MTKEEPIFPELRKDDNFHLPFFIYNSTVYTPDLKLFAKEMLFLLPENHTHLITSSSSGGAIATAMMILSEKPLDVLYIRKKNESSYATRTISCISGVEYVFVDDLISNGDTLQRCLDALDSEEATISHAITIKEVSNVVGERVLKEHNIISYHVKYNP